MNEPTGIGAPWIEDLATRLESPAPVRHAPGEGREAAVLVPLYVDAGALWTVLTQRSQQLPHHRGQIAFPGGGREIGEDPWTTALREAEEEVSLPPDRVLRLGHLDEIGSPTGFRVVPCVGAIPWPTELEPDGGEIEEVFTVPLFAFADITIAEDRKVKIDGRERNLRIYHVAGRQIWGLTAAILQNLLARLGVEGALLNSAAEGE